jgi:hypothetical protein
MGMRYSIAEALLTFGGICLVFGLLGVKPK